MADIELGVGAICALGSLKADHDVGKGALWMDEGLALCLAPLELKQDLFPCIATPRRIAMELPPPSQLLLGIEVDLHVVAIAHGARGVTKQAFGDDEFLRPHIFGRR